MSYRCGIMNSGPCVVCDTCGWERSIMGRSNCPAGWFTKGKASPGWQGGKNPDGNGRWDKCWQCVEKEERAKVT